ncbi:MAG: alpha-galactosidase [Eubacteriales bacterium]|nr:alpha-galactosidase [Sarcina sp.]MDO4417605.1 alpha-galactosidase [Eubacteriales bacterium]
MAIRYHESTRTFHLFNDQISYVIRIMENEQPEHLYYGKKVFDEESFALYHEEEMRSQMSVCVPEPGLLSMQYTKQEYPCYGTGDYRSPAFSILQKNGSRVTEFRYAGHSITAGKPSLLPLPATYVEQDDEAQTLEIRLHDALMDTDLFLLYTIYEKYPVVTRSARFEHHGPDPVILEKAMSMSVEWSDMDFTMISLAGAWSRERYIKERKLEMGISSVQGLSGTCSSAEQNPFLALARPGCTEEQGEVYGFSLLYSGNFLAQTEVSTFDMTRLMMGINPESFSWELQTDGTFQTPETVMVYSGEGLGGMSRTFHRLYRKRLMRGIWRDRPRPILLNNWEATYFDFTEDRLLEIAAGAKACGIELFVLDDGWFGVRDDDTRSLGDWYCNLKKIPSGIDGISRKVEAMGMKFGLWVELEMVNENSDLYRAHPEWVIGAPGRFNCHARHQFVLDYSNPEVVDHIFKMISGIISSSAISYIKWDMNRYMTGAFSSAAWARDEEEACPARISLRQGEMMHRYTLGLYTLYEKLTQAFPEILFESCASGGARFDAGLLYWAPQAWCSDDTDASERQKIQYGTSYVYPVVSMGSHVSAVPNHQLMRTTPLETRANIAYFGTFGYELDLNLLSEKELDLVRSQVRFMKDHRQLIQIDGDFYRLRNPFKGNETAWMVVSPDRSRAVAVYCQRLNKVNGSLVRLRLRGLDPEKQYEVTYDTTPAVNTPGQILALYGYKTDAENTTQTLRLHGSTLMHAGIPISRQLLTMKGGDFASVLLEIRETCAPDTAGLRKT